MKRLFAYLRALLDDLIFQRVCAALFSALIALFGAVMVVAAWQPSGWDWALWVFFLAITVYGLIIFCTAVFGSDRAFKRASSYLEDGGHPAALVLVLLVVVIAVPITVVIRKLRPKNAL